MQSFGIAAGSAAAVSASRTVPLVLVADDDEDILTLVALRFRRSGLEVILARDGEEALELIQTRAPDAAVLDIAMPKLTGLEVVRRLRDSERKRVSRKSCAHATEVTATRPPTPVAKLSSPRRS
jgi:CheY-like chemotaxis protein